MTPNVQRALAIALVVIAVAYLAWRGSRTWRASRRPTTSSGCGSGCGCE